MSVIYICLAMFVILCGICVVNVLNPVHSVFFLVLLFLLNSIFLFLLRNEFLAIMFIIVYIGAIAVLFLFVIMMLNVKIQELKSSYLTYLPISIVFLIILFYEFLFVFESYSFVFFDSVNEYVVWLNYYMVGVTNVHMIGLYLYNYYFVAFILAGILLFIATLGAITLTHLQTVNFFYERVNFKQYQNVSDQYFVDYKMRIF